MAVVAALSVLAACASPAGIAPGARPLSADAVAPKTAPGTADGSGTAATPAPGAAWWRDLGDPDLTALVERALAGHPDLAMASARLARAQAVADGVRGLDGPQVSGKASVTRQRFSENSIYPPPLGGSIRTLGDAQVAASWELDFFGRNRAALDAALGAARAAEADLDAARVALASNVARQYVQLAGLFESRAVEARALAQREAMLKLIRSRVQGGLDSVVELRQGEGALPETRQRIALIDERIGSTRRVLAALTGQAPDALDGLVPSLERLRPMTLPAVVPADLLGHRADIVAARARIEAATGDFSAARAQFYPNVDLGAFFGFTSLGLERLLKSGSAQYGVSPAISLPIFDSGRLRANLRGKAADVDAAIEAYNGLVLEAIRQAADGVGVIRAVDRQRIESRQALAAAESAWDLAMQRYKAGLGSYLTVLSAETGVLAQRRLAADLDVRTLDSQLQLVRALGGGYTL